MWITAFKPDRVDSSAEFTPGTVGALWDGTAFKVYKYVLYDEGTGALDLAAGDVVYYVDDTGYGASTVTADASDATGAEIGAGVAVAAVTDDASYFWIQIKGPATLSTTIGGAAGDGAPLTATGAADKALTLATEGAGTLTHVCAVAVDASAKEVICDFPF